MYKGPVTNYYKIRGGPCEVLPLRKGGGGKSLGLVLHCSLKF